MGGRIASASGPASFANDVWWSANGSEWMQATADAGWEERQEHTCVVHAGKMWVIGGFRDFDDHFQDVWFSEDGVNWTLATSNPPWSARNSHTSVVHDGKIWVLGGNAATGPANDVWHSVDGITWTQATSGADWMERYAHASVSYQDRIWVIGGHSGGFGLDDAWSSSDGTNWTQETAEGPWDARWGHGVGVLPELNGTIWLVGGDSGSPGEFNDDWYATCADQVAICSANPPLDNPFVEGQRPFRDVLQDQGVGGAPQGIGSCLTPSEGPVDYCTISIAFSTPVDLAIDEVVVACSYTGTPPGSTPCPAVEDLEGSGAGPYVITLSGAIPPGGCATLTFGDAAPGVELRYEFLPGDVNMNGTTNTQDLLAIIQGLNQGVANVPANLARYDMNRSGIVNTQDLLRLVQLLNGTNATRTWNGATVVTCP